MKIFAHVVPRGDLVEHALPLTDEGEQCVCGPRLELFRCQETGELTFLSVHHSLDGREALET